MKRGSYLQAGWKGRSMFLQPSTVVKNVFYVDNTNGSNSNNGRDWQRAFSTLNYAISKGTDDIGDVIYLAPYHAETIDAAVGSASGVATDELVIDKCGITIIGLGYGQLRPTFTLGSTAGADVSAAIAVTAATTNIVIDNIIVTSGLADLAAGITLTATSDGATIRNCEFKDGGTDLELVIGITIAAACDDVEISNCYFYGGHDDASGVELAGASDRLKFIGNVMQGTFSNCAFDGDAAASADMIITNNIIANTGNLGCGLNGGCTGIFSYNLIAGGSGTVATSLTDAAAMWRGENYVTDAVGASGIVYPNADGD